MKTIFKQLLKITDKQVIRLESNYNILSAGSQRDQICIWYACESRCEPEEVEIYIFGTGNPIPNDFNGDFIGTVVMGIFVWHVFRKI